jgi:hypothetical protein
VVISLVFWDNLISIVTMLWAGVSGVQLLAVVRGFQFSKTCGLALGPTWSRLEWVLGVLAPEGKAAGT